MPEAFSPILRTTSLPLTLLSGILLPLTLAPLWLQRLAAWNPFSWAVRGLRAMFAGDLGDGAVWRSIVIIGALAVIAVSWSARQFNRSIR